MPHHSRQRPRPFSRLEAVAPALAVGAALLLSACVPGTYPSDIFPEMHYQAWHRPLEPDRVAAPAESVPRSGRPPTLSYVQATDLANPLEASATNLERAALVHQQNCAVCHGEDGRGEAVMAVYFAANGPYPPTSFASERVRQRSDGQLYWIIRHGLGNMPPFRQLLSEEDVWLSVLYVRAVGGQP